MVLDAFYSISHNAAGRSRDLYCQTPDLSRTWFPERLYGYYWKNFNRTTIWKAESLL
jgi:hypothetical protein